jgi:uncharacterized protein YoxC
MARNQKLAATVTIGSVLQNSVKKNIGVLKSGLQGVSSEIKSVTTRQRELSKQRKVLEKQGKSVEALDREYEELGRTLADLERKQKRWARAAAASANVGRKFSKMSQEVGRFGRATVVAGTAAGAAIFGIANSTASLGDEVAKTADKLGFQIEAFQELRYAAERSGVSTATFDSSMVAMTKRLGEAANGTGAAKKELDRLGLSAKALVKMEPDEALAAIAEKMEGIESPAERAAVASALFSRAGVGMVNMLRDGSDGLQQLREDAQRTGYVLSEKAARDAEVFKDQLLDAQLTVAGLKNTIGAALMPVVTRSMGQFANFMTENREGVEAFALAFADGVESALPVVGEIVSGMVSVSAKVGRVTSTVADMVGGWENFGMIVGGIFASRAIMSVGSFVGSVLRLGTAMVSLTGVLPFVAGGIKAIGAALLANPIGIAVAAIAGGAALIYKNWESVGPWFKDRLGNVGDVFGGLGDTVSSVVRGDMQGAVDGLNRMWGGFSSFWSGMVDGVGSVIRAGYNNVIKPVTDKLGITEPIERAWAWLRDSISGVIDSIGAKFKWLADALAPVIESLKWVYEKGEAAVSKVSSALNRNTGPAPGSPENPYPPGHPLHRPQARALGGIFNKGALLVGEHGPELRYESRGGYVAHNRATERLAALASKAKAGFSAATQSAVQSAGQVVQNITINAAGLSAAQVADEIERRGRSAASGSLFDRPAGYGQYGGL